MGMDYDVSGTIVESLRTGDRFKFSFLSEKKAQVTFEGERIETGCRSVRTESFGSRVPMIGPILNFLIFKVIYRKKANRNVIRDNMILDNQYLTDILVNGKYPR